VKNILKVPISDQSRSILSMVMRSFLVLLFLILPLIVPSSAGFAGTAYQTGSSIISSNIVVLKNAGTAGYLLESAKAGSTLSIGANWNIPSFSCTSSSAPLYFDIAVSHIYTNDAASHLLVVCSGTTPQYSIWYSVGSGYIQISLPVYAGDLMKTSASENVLTGATTVSITDMTGGHGWGAEFNGNVAVDTTSSAYVGWTMSIQGVASSRSPIPNFTPLKLSSITAILGGHSGKLGSFLSIRGIAIQEYILVGSTDNVLVTPTPITSISSSFKLKWMAGY
jgi:hypothetical protein